MKPTIGIIGGSGLYSMPGFEAHEERKIDTPWGAPSDSYIVGSLAGKEVAFLARHARGHRYSPSELNFRANIWGMKSLGVERILSLSAVGSLKEEHKPLDFVIPYQFVDRTRGRISTFFGEGLVAHVSFAHPICSQMADIAFASGRDAGISVKQAVLSTRNRIWDSPASRKAKPQFTTSLRYVTTRMSEVKDESTKARWIEMWSTR